MKLKNLRKWYEVLLMLEQGRTQQAADYIHTLLHDNGFYTLSVKGVSEQAVQAPQSQVGEA